MRSWEKLSSYDVTDQIFEPLFIGGQMVSPEYTLKPLWYQHIIFSMMASALCFRIGLPSAFNILKTAS